ncbi:hypothetical protein G4B88_010204 [Cannabis sativa]|uniref:NAD(P)H-quinone oxidoreductase subunit 2 N-terminal domain-containing protein n=1 Tax=Cannabis sativa TaxID=3483 RepID=A0A7J6I585_CANSA|nr:hypothetical protein G4B88_010204 [Cannabis sativa]
MDQLSPLEDFFKNKKEESHNFYESLSFASLQWKFYFTRMYPNFWPNLLLMIDSTSDQKDIPWLYFISSTSLVMSIMTLLFRWREEPMISFSGNFQTNISKKSFILLFYYVQLYVFLYP